MVIALTAKMGYPSFSFAAEKSPLSETAIKF
jgi:hypothetical protein